MSATSGRNAFEVRSDDRDYSGLSIADRLLTDANIERSFFSRPTNGMSESAQSRHGRLVKIADALPKELLASY
jgi:hypothetical protein